MIRLSILVPHLSATEPFEDTLVSVLQNRPEDCEVLVVHRGRYDDPYALNGEVRFVGVAAGASVSEMVNAGFRVAAGEIVHLLLPGTTVVEGWTEPILRWFDQADVGAVAPVMLAASRPERVAAAGVRATPFGSRRVHGAGTRLPAKRLLRRRILGPTLDAGFYRAAAVVAVGGFCGQMGLAFADIDLAVAMQAEGWICALEPASRVLGRPESSRDSQSFRYGRYAERFYRRHKSVAGLFSAKALHPVAVVGNWLCQAYRWGAFARFLGQLSVAFERPRRREQALASAPLLAAPQPGYSDAATRLPRRAA